VATFDIPNLPCYSTGDCSGAATYTHVTGTVNGTLTPSTLIPGSGTLLVTIHSAPYYACNAGPYTLTFSGNGNYTQSFLGITFPSWGATGTWNKH
jgi:hypothetical protein